MSLISWLCQPCNINGDKSRLFYSNAVSIINVLRSKRAKTPETWSYKSSTCQELDSVPSFCLGHSPMWCHTRTVQGNLHPGGIHDTSCHCTWKETHRERRQSSHWWSERLQRKERRVSGNCVNQKICQDSDFCMSRCVQQTTSSSSSQDTQTHA